MSSFPKNQFSSTYSQYWRKLTEQAPSVSGVPDSEIARSVINTLLEERGRGFNPSLDAACGSGRLFQVLSEYSEDIDGVDVEASAVATARLSPYKNVYVNALEDFKPRRKYELIVCWAAFEVLQQQQILSVFENSLSSKGVVIITAKSANYELSDLEAIRAEAGAARRGFRQFFVDTQAFAHALPEYGLEIVRTITFEKRGDFANGAFEVFERGIPEKPFYEFAVSLRKVAKQRTLRATAASWSLPVSKTFEMLHDSTTR